MTADLLNPGGWEPPPTWQKCARGPSISQLALTATQLAAWALSAGLKRNRIVPESGFGQRALFQGSLGAFWYTRIMTKADLNQIAWSVHELMLGGRPDPRTEALVHQTEDLISEIQRLHGVVREAATYLKNYDPKVAERIVSQIDCTTITPGI